MSLQGAHCGNFLEWWKMHEATGTVRYLSEMGSCIPGSPALETAQAAKVSRHESGQGSGFMVAG